MTQAFPADWRRSRLREIATLQTGVAKGRRNLRSPVSRPYLRVANVQDGHLELDSVKEIAVEADEVARYELRPGDVLLTEGGDNDKLGRGTVWNGEIPGCLHQNHVFAVRPNPQSLAPEYLAALIHSRYGRRYFNGSAKQTTNLASINATQVREFVVVAPEVDEQRRIAAALETFRSYVDRVGRVLEAKRRFKRGLMQELLTGKRRFKEFVRSPGYKSTAAGRLPADWGVQPLRALFTPVNRRNADGIDLVLTASGQHGLVDQREYFTRSVAGEDLKRYYLLKKGEFAYNRSLMKDYP